MSVSGFYLRYIDTARWFSISDTPLSDWYYCSLSKGELYTSTIIPRPAVPYQEMK